ncbi:hypothetical protein DN748_18515 [Sinomicrobium soli]|nr:hypothetical protein DN748_18515 [Sinomicrobium sp. N-1-3-6]
MLFAVLLSCSKDDDNTDNGGDGAGNSFTFQGENHPTESATYQLAVNNTVISLNSFDPDNQIIFLFREAAYDDLGGNYTYKDVFDPDYDPEMNFGDMTVYLGDDIYEDFNEGSLTLSKDGNNIDIAYSFSGQSGSVTGSYSGPIAGQ